MATKRTVVDIETRGGDAAKRELRGIGNAGQRAFKRIQDSTKPASGGLRALSGASRELQGTAQGLASRLGPLGGVLASIGPAGLAAAGIAGAAGGLFAVTKSALNTADAIGKAADRIGVGTSTLQEYRFAAEQSGVSTDQLDKGFEQLTKRLGEARAGTGTLVEFLKKSDQALLQNVQAAKSTDEALDLIFEAMANAGSAAERAAIANAAFGRSGIALTNVVRDGADGLEAMRAKARSLGLVLDEEMIRSSERANDRLNELGRTISTNLTQAFITLAPHIETAAGKLVDASIGARKFLDAIFGTPIDTSRLQGVALEISNIEDAIRRLDEGDPGSVGERFVDGFLRNLPAGGLVDALFGDSPEQTLANLKAKLAELTAEREKLLQARLDARGKEAAATEGALSDLEREKQAIAGLAEADKLLAGLPEKIRDLIPKDLQIQIDEAAFDRQLANVRATISASGIAEPQKKDILAALDPQKAKKVRKQLDDLVKPETKTITVRTVNAGVSGSAAAGLLEAAEPGDISTSGRQAVLEGRREAYQIANGDIRTRRIPTGPIEGAPIVHPIEGSMSPSKPLREIYEDDIPELADRTAARVSRTPLGFDVTQARDDLLEIEGIAERIARITSTPGAPIDFRGKFLELGGGTRLSTRPTAISSLSSEAVMQGVQQISGFLPGTNQRLADTFAALKGEQAKQLTEVARIRAANEEANRLLIEAARGSQETAAAVDRLSAQMRSGAWAGTIANAIESDLRSRTGNRSAALSAVSRAWGAGRTVGR